jgi:hypothetical protein
MFPLSALSEPDSASVSDEVQPVRQNGKVPVRGGIAVWLRRRPIHPVKPAPTLGRFYSNHPSVLGPAYSGPSDPPYCRWKRTASRTHVRFALYVSTDNRLVGALLAAPPIGQVKLCPYTPALPGALGFTGELASLGLKPNTVVSRAPEPAQFVAE